MSRQGAVAPLLAVLAMLVFGFGVYMTLGMTQSSAVRHANPPPPPPAPKPSATPLFTLPGSIFLVQGGALYRYHAGGFTELGKPAGWSQPSASPDGGHLVAVKRGPNVSDLYQLGLDGSVQKQLTNDASRIVEVNHWAFYPRYSADGSQLFFSTDKPKTYDYRVDLAVWSMAAGGGVQREWTSPRYYTGGDVQPMPLAGGGLIYTKYTIDDTGQSASQLMLVERPMGAGIALTQPADHCSEASVSPDGTRLAMICLAGARTARLVVAPFDGHQLGARQVVVEGTLAAAPAWAPDGSGLVYFAPGAGDPGGGFQLWWAPLTGTPRQMTSRLSFDALSPPVWLKS